ncbi:cysteine proteinase [Lindgomyces ingoldianus]|uniref:Cysteine proteinase n=1 Tax=Lindgomyces ingoldianus TaxID=673940 RepID=A0ACB6QEE1_9PLEO|nr:cysteine proteinase [Lindgomyces ingoldianus]KAF2465343.1 cysteine proteinase [Lindgomyces ingoldianus]
MDSTNLSTEKDYPKHFIPLESNPEVFTELIHKPGVTEPVYALVLVFATTEAYDKQCADVECRLGAYEGHYQQCFALYGILHAVCNGDARNSIGTESVLGRLLKRCLPLKPDERALGLVDSDRLEAAYASVAKKGDTAAPENPEDEVDFRYISFMDGERKRLIDLGELGAEEDVLSDKCLMVIRDLVENPKGGDLNFSLIALVPV